MDNASKNAKDMISTLTMQYNRGRQAAITNELVDIITGMSPTHPLFASAAFGSHDLIPDRCECFVRLLFCSVCIGLLPSVVGLRNRQNGPFLCTQPLERQRLEFEHYHAENHSA